MSRFSEIVRKRIDRSDSAPAPVAERPSPDAGPANRPAATGATRGDVVKAEAEKHMQQAARAAARQVSPSTPPPSASTSPAGDQPSAERGGSNKLLKVVLGLAGIGLSLTMMHNYASFVAPIFLTLNLMITAYPLYRLLTRYRVPKAVATTVTGLTVVAILALFLYGMYWSVQSMVDKLPEYSEQFNQFYTQIIDQLARLGLDEANIAKQIKQIDPKSVAGFAAGLLSNVSSVGSMVLIILTSMIFMIMDTPEIHERLQLARTTHSSFVDSLGDFAQGIRRYWVVTTVFGLIVAILDGAVLLGLGVPLALVWAIFSFLTNYIPNIGFVIGLVPPALLALLANGPKTAIAVVVAYSVLNFVVQSIIQPKFAGNAVGLTPTLSFISLLLWTAVLGPLGALLALPASLLVKAFLVDPDPETRWVNALISSRPQDAIDPEPVHYSN
ncbi:AI-2E family transporter [Aestuariimicrobium sp. p3-SID1156]|uniref:AI-2E family transporter n=1 Tax=Aestuariimicrobium sp. p3-SID1156 TaxID=2916038 RepID=UPI00223AA387|nr:AI-2E family transporter [Aestuariimicrobium sp. p3-SID1156]MCT1459172.1 AI-2E family transporter [Aestuariimicrobium sp. p3-SID1156]